MNEVMSMLAQLKEMPRTALVGFLAPLVALICIFVAIAISPDFLWTDNALSDLGHYTRIDIGPNPEIRAIIFNSGLVITGIMMLIFTLPLVKNMEKPLTKFGMLVFVIAELFLIGIGIFSENFGSIHFLVSVGFFFSFPFAMWFVGIDWMWRGKIRAFALLSIALPFGSIFLWYQQVVAPIWSGVAIPEMVTALTAICWIWAINLFIIQGKLEDVMKST